MLHVLMHSFRGFFQVFLIAQDLTSHKIEQHLRFFLQHQKYDEA